MFTTKYRAVVCSIVELLWLLVLAKYHLHSDNTCTGLSVIGSCFVISMWMFLFALWWVGHANSKHCYLFCFRVVSTKPVSETRNTLRGPDDCQAMQLTEVEDEDVEKWERSKPTDGAMLKAMIDWLFAFCTVVTQTVQLIQINVHCCNCSFYAIIVWSVYYTTSNITYIVKMLYYIPWLGYVSSFNCGNPWHVILEYRSIKRYWKPDSCI